jgi:ATP-binding cassette, subfamily B, bacterial MsbA
MSTTPRPATGIRRYFRHLHHLRAAQWQFFGGLIAGAFYSISSGVGLPVIFKTVLPIFFGQEKDASPAVVAFAKRMFGEAYTEKLLLVACLALPVIFFVRGLSSFANRYLLSDAGFRILEGLRQEVFDRLQQLPLAFYQRNKSGDLASRVMGDTEQLKNVIVNVSSEIIKQPLTLISALGYLVYLSVTERSALFAMIAILSVPLCILPIRVAAKLLIKKSREVAQQNGELSAIVTETLQSPLEIQTYNLQNQQRSRFQQSIRGIFKLSMKTIKYQALLSPIIEFVSVGGFVAALYFGTRNGMDFATFSALGIALYMAYEPVKKLSNIHALIKIGDASLERLEHILDAEDTVPAHDCPVPLPRGPQPIVLKNVTFNYAYRDGVKSEPALNDVSVTITPGETVALVGASGAGKSTFISLIPRLFDPTSGLITLGGVDLRLAEKTDLRNRIAIVPQLPVLFNSTIADNIRVGRPSASDEEVKAAAEKAHISGFIEQLPEGYATWVGERGASLSGGQRQRIAIARAFLKDAPILILDEATSALDSESEAMIQQALALLVRGRTTLMIAHRFSSIRQASRILVFDQGRIVADGHHDQLHAENSLYQSLYNLQQAKS